LLRKTDVTALVGNQNDQGKKNSDLLFKCLILGFFTLIILSSASFTSNENITRDLPNGDPLGKVEPSAPAVEETFESYADGSNINGQGHWVAVSNPGCTATVATLGMTVNKWLRRPFN